MNRFIAKRIPMYNAIASLTKRFAGMDGKEFAPVEIDLYDCGTRAMGFLVEYLPRDRCAVFVPAVPVATVGNLFIVASDKVHHIDASMSDTVTVITQWGVNAADLFRGSEKSGAGGDPV